MANNWLHNIHPGFGPGSSTADYDLMKLIQQERTGSSEELPAFLDLLTGSSEYIPDVPYTTNAPVRREFYPQETAHSAIDSLIVNNQRPDVRNFPGQKVINSLFDVLELAFGSGMPIENPAKYKKP